MHGPRRLVAAAVVLAMTACGSSSGAGGTALRVNGSSTVNPVAADAAESLRRDGLKITVDTQGGSAGGIAQLAGGQIDIAMSSKPVTEEDRSAHPGVNFVTTVIGEDALGIVVRREIFDGGVRSLGREQLRAVFEGRVANWKQLGGPDLVVFVYDKEPGRGTREVLEAYLYGRGTKAPPPPTGGNYAVVGGNEEARAKLESTPGAVAPLSVAFTSGREKLAIVAVDGVRPAPERVGDRTYPLSRPLFLVTNGPPTGSTKQFVDYVLSDSGQALVRKHGFLTLAELGSR